MCQTGCLDEVESISVSRKALFKGSEPSDSIRAVNILLTQLDQLMVQPNVFIMATSNLTEAIDPAFLDRVDCIYEIGLPGEASRYDIITGGIRELMRVGLVEEHPVPTFSIAKLGSGSDARLLAVARKLTAISGRQMTKLPLLAFSQAKRVRTIPPGRSHNQPGWAV